MAAILLIEDDELARIAVRIMLERNGHDVVEASDGNKGISAVRSRKIDLVVTDLIMPEKGGIGTIVQLNRDYPNLSIIAISGGGPARNHAYLDAAKRAGAKRVLKKPFTEGELMELVSHCLGEVTSAGIADLATE